MISCDVSTSPSPLRSDEILNWFEISWKPQHTDSTWLSVWSRVECFKRQTVLNKLPPNLDFHGYTFAGVEALDCDVVLASIRLNDADGEIESAYGAYVYHFVSQDQQHRVSVAAVCASYSDSGCDFTALACVPESFTASWSAFEGECSR